jgi:hypothetical protein
MRWADEQEGKTLMPVVITFDEGRTNQSIYDFAAVAGVSLSAAVTQAARNWVRALINLTPPSKKSILGDTKAQQKYGQEKVLNDVKSLFPRLDFMAENTRLPGLKARLKKDISSHDRADATKALSGAGFSHVVNVVTGPSRDLHAKFASKKDFHIKKGERGKFPVMSTSAWTAYLTLEQARVGWLKGGWNTAANKLGLRVPGWIKKHGASPGYFRGITDQMKPEIEFGNQVPYITDRYYEVICASAGRQAFKLLEKQAQFYLAEIGRGNKAKMQARARQQSGEALEV